MYRGDDKVVRFFTRDTKTYDPSAERSLHNALAETRAREAQNSSNVNVASLPSLRDQLTLKGDSDGAVKMFQRDGVAWAYQWSVPSATWIELGEVTGTGTGGQVDGRHFDLVIPVEIEAPGTGTIRNMEIGFNQGGEREREGERETSCIL
jgi:phospholipase A-2-activating protein